MTQTYIDNQSNGIKMRKEDGITNPECMNSKESEKSDRSEQMTQDGCEPRVEPQEPAWTELGRQKHRKYQVDRDATKMDAQCMTETLEFGTAWAVCQLFKKNKWMTDTEFQSRMHGGFTSHKQTLHH